MRGQWLTLKRLSVEMLAFFSSHWEKTNEKSEIWKTSQMLTMFSIKASLLCILYIFHMQMVLDFHSGFWVLWVISKIVESSLTFDNWGLSWSLTIFFTCFKAKMTFLSSSVTMTPSEMTLSTLFLMSLFLFMRSSREGSFDKALQNASTLLRLCSTEFIKQVLPRFLSPTRFLGDFFPLLPPISWFSFFEDFIFGFLAGRMVFVSSTRFRRARSERPVAWFSASASRVSFLVSTRVRRLSRNLWFEC